MATSAPQPLQLGNFLLRTFTKAGTGAAQTTMYWLPSSPVVEVEPQTRDP